MANVDSAAAASVGAFIAAEILGKGMATFRRLAGGFQAAVCVNRVRKSKVLPTKRAARLWAAEMEVKLSKGAVFCTKTNMADLFQRYTQEICGEKKGARWEVIRLRTFCRYPWAKIKLANVRREDIERWIDYRLKSVKPSTVNRELTLLSHCFTQARRWRLMGHKPMADLKKPRNPPPRNRRIKPHETQSILAALQYSESVPVVLQSQRVAVAFLFALETAMRAGEICALWPEHINEQQRTALLVDTKNGRPRKVPLSLEALRLIRRLDPWPEAGPLFGMASPSLSATFKKGVTKAGVEGLTFHDSRHEAITRLAKKLEVLDLARMVGHRDIRQLMVYYHPTAEELALLLD